MESLQCKNVAAWAVPAAVKAGGAAGDTRGRAVRISMSQNQGHLKNSPSSSTWRVRSSSKGSSRVHRGDDKCWCATVENANSFENTKTGSQWFEPSEVYGGEGSSLVTMERLLENEDGKSVEDYKRRAHMFSESAAFFSALKDRNNNGVDK